MEIKFLGGAGTVTGSKYLLQTQNGKYLVDCGLFQGLKELRLKNWAKTEFNPKDLDAIILTHAHIDHSGYIPLVFKKGFSNQIHCTVATKQLCEILLPDSGYLQEEEAKRCNKYGYTKHSPAMPLYTKEDAESSLSLFKTHEYNKSVKLEGQFSFEFVPAGHILGSSIVKMDYMGKKIVFSGDLGRQNDLLLKPPATITEADYLFIESTYGDRLHNKADPLEEMAKVINRTQQRGGIVIMPAFAVGRAQTLLYSIKRLKQEQRIPDIPTYLDSPMAIDATGILLKNQNEQKLPLDELNQICHAATYVNTPDHSRMLDTQDHSKIIISASGMVTGGRVLHHIYNLSQNEKNTILFTGYQAVGTRGAQLLEGKKDIKIFGETIDVKAEVVKIDNLSAHADYSEILTWMETIKESPRKIFITHGEPEAAQSLKEKIESKFGFTCVVPEMGHSEKL